MSDLWNATTKPENAAIIAFIGVLFSLLVSLTIARKASYLTSVTAERSKWIDKLRENLAAFFGIGGAIMNTVGTPSTQDIEKADRLVALIKMQLNPSGSIDSNIINLCDRILEQLPNKGNQYRHLEKATIRHAQFLLKEEWETVKYEATGWLGKLLFRFRACQRECKYKEFCKSIESGLIS